MKLNRQRLFTQEQRCSQGGVLGDMDPLLKNLKLFFFKFFKIISELFEKFKFKAEVFKKITL